MTILSTIDEPHLALPALDRWSRLRRLARRKQHTLRVAPAAPAGPPPKGPRWKTAARVAATGVGGAADEIDPDEEPTESA